MHIAAKLHLETPDDLADDLPDAMSYTNLLDAVDNLWSDVMKREIKLRVALARFLKAEHAKLPEILFTSWTLNHVFNTVQDLRLTRGN